MAFLLTGGNINDCTQLTALLEAITVPRPGLGPPRRRPERVIADKGYSSRAIRLYLRQRGIPATIPERADQIAGRGRRGHRGGRPPAFDRAIYRRRNVVERCFQRLKQFRGIATRYDQTAVSYRATITLAALLLWSSGFENAP